MSDKLKYFVEAWEMNGVGQTVATVQDSPGTVVAITVDDLRALLARRQPAAIDKQEARDAFDEEDEFQAWWKTRVGKTTNAYHGWMARADRDAAPLDKDVSQTAAPLESPKETMERLTRQFNQMSELERAVIGDFIKRAAPSVEQDEREAFCKWVMSKGAAWWANVYPEQAAEFAWMKRAASTYANVAQGAEVQFEWPALPDLPVPVKTELKGPSFKYAQCIAYFSDHQMQGYANAYGEAIRAAFAARPAQTALTDEQILEIASEYQTVVPGNCLYIVEFARAILAAQSASGADHD